LLEIMQDAGCYYVDVGIESGSQRVLDQCIGKAIRLDGAEELLRWTDELGLLTKIFFTVGHPGETFAEAKETNRFYWKHRRRIRLAGYHAGVRVYPGTEVETFARKENLLPEGFHWSAPFRNEANAKLLRSMDNVPMLLQPGLGLEELQKIRMQFIMMRLTSPKFVLEKVRNIAASGALGEYLRMGARWARASTGGKPDPGVKDTTRA
jgi:hypothetical protein